MKNQELSQRGKNNKRKGNQFEREVAILINKIWNKEVVRRNRRSGADDWFPGDIIFSSSCILKELCAPMELKNRKNFSWNAYGQGRTVVFHRFGWTKSVFIMDFENFLNMAKELEDLRNIVYRKEKNERNNH